MRESFVYIGFLVVGLVGGFFIGHFLQNGVLPPTSIAGQDMSISTSTEKAFALVVQNKKIVSGSGDITVNQGDTVTLVVTNDTDEEVHLHGYNIMVDLSAGKPGVLTFTATQSGRFPFELEHSGTDLGAISVLPQ